MKWTHLWTEERVELLKQLWHEGYSGAQIAARLGGITRNSAIGKIHRLGLPGQEKKHYHKAIKPVGSPEKRRSPSRFNPTLNHKNLPTELPAQPAEANRSIVCCPKPVHLLDRNMLTECGWLLVSDGSFAERLCCGNPIDWKHSQSLCAAHYRIAHCKVDRKAA